MLTASNKTRIRRDGDSHKPIETVDHPNGRSVGSFELGYQGGLIHHGTRGGLGNSDSPISDSLAQPRPWQSRYTEEQAHEKDEKESQIGRAHV